MKLPKDQPFWTSVILHCAVLLGLFLATIVQAFKPKEKPHVFEMVDPPSEVAQPQASTPPPLPSVELPEPELLPVPQVEIPKPRPPAPTPRPVETPKPKAETPLVDFRDFNKEHPKEDPKPRQVTRVSKPAPQIDIPRPIIPQNPAPNNPSPQLSPQQVSALADYSTRLRARIDTVWNKPAQLAGVRLVAEVVFDVSASGRISNARLRPGSGNTAFDQSVLAAFNRASSAGPTPTGQAYQFSLTFRMQD